MPAPGIAIGMANRQRILEWLVAHPGGTNQECAAALGISNCAVGRHVKHIRQQWTWEHTPTSSPRT